MSNYSHNFNKSTKGLLVEHELKLASSLTFNDFKELIQKLKKLTRREYGLLSCLIDFNAASLKDEPIEILSNSEKQLWNESSTVQIRLSPPRNPDFVRSQYDKDNPKVILKDFVVADFDKKTNKLHLQIQYRKNGPINGANILNGIKEHLNPTNTGKKIRPVAAKPL